MRLFTVCSVALVGCAGGLLAAAGSSAKDRAELRAPAAFTGIADTPARSVALFNEAAKVLTHPRCMNCHPAGEHPLQGADRRPHYPPVRRGAADAGGPATPCAG